MLMRFDECTAVYLNFADADFLHEAKAYWGFEGLVGDQAPVGFWDPLGLSKDNDLEVFKRLGWCWCRVLQAEAVGWYVWYVFKKNNFANIWALAGVVRPRSSTAGWRCSQPWARSLSKCVCIAGWDSDLAWTSDSSSSLCKVTLPQSTTDLMATCPRPWTWSLATCQTAWRCSCEDDAAWFSVISKDSHWVSICSVSIIYFQSVLISDVSSFSCFVWDVWTLAILMLNCSTLNQGALRGAQRGLGSDPCFRWLPRVGCQQEDLRARRDLCFSLYVAWVCLPLGIFLRQLWKGQPRPWPDRLRQLRPGSWDKDLPTWLQYMVLHAALCSFAWSSRVLERVSISTWCLTVWYFFVFFAGHENLTQNSPTDVWPWWPLSACLLLCN